MKTPTPLHRPLRTIVAALVVIGSGLAGLVALPQVAQGADMSKFDPGHIISDTVFYDSGAMSEQAVQSFLATKGAACRPAADGTPCLKDYRQTTVDRPADARCPRSYVGAANETAAAIITKVAQACGINPRVLIVTLQKEQSLVTRTTAGTAETYRKAMGYGCPDTAVCDAKYYGFFNQVYSAASQFRNYALNPTRYNFRAGQTNTILYHPAGASSCGSSQVLIRNQATASLYNYTPYQPNAAALAAGYGTGDGCSSYGNRNFWSYFTDWFGSTISSAPVGFLDSATVVGASTLRLSGWALDPDTYNPITVHAYVDGSPYGTVANTSRPDVGAAYPGWGESHGFTLDVPVAEGRHSVCVYGINEPVGPNPLLGCATVTAVNSGPTGFLDGVTATPSSIVVAGWAWDRDTTDPVELHVYIDGRHLGTTRAEGSRPDVAAAVAGAGPNRGFSAEIPVAAGAHQVCVYAINVPTSTNVSLGCRSVTVVNAQPTGFLDQATGSAGAVTATGWAWDADAGAPTALHVYVDGAFAGSTVTGLPRPDVAAAVSGASGLTGFSVQLPAPAGQHQVCVYAINAPTGHNPLIACRAGVTVS